VERGLEASRERARRLIVAGDVTVNGQVARAPSTLVPPDAALAIGKALPYVSRGGVKLAHALDRFGIAITGRVCLDAGASTGGFTDVLLQRGAARIYAADVGKGLLAWSLRQDPRVVVLEETNIRYLGLATTPAEATGSREEGAALPLRPLPSPVAATRVTPSPEQAPPALSPQSLVLSPPHALVLLPEPVSLVVADLAFISLRLVLPALTGVLAPDGELVALVKPQFEAGPASVGKGGVVRDPRVHRRVLQEVLADLPPAGLHPRGLTASPIRGQAGNVEFLLWATRAGPVPFDEPAALDAALAEAPSVHNP
jgi:23S rRNA (cytidine1920-2'-O)/16S rRNA (cytidine1409-2'-O)-methyltransferase